MEINSRQSQYRIDLNINGGNVNGIDDTFKAYFRRGNRMWNLPQFIITWSHDTVTVVAMNMSVGYLNIGNIHFAVTKAANIWIRNTVTSPA